MATSTADELGKLWTRIGVDAFEFAAVILGEHLQSDFSKFQASLIITRGERIHFCSFSGFLGAEVFDPFLLVPKVQTLHEGFLILLIFCHAERSHLALAATIEDLRRRQIAYSVAY